MKKVLVTVVTALALAGVLATPAAAAGSTGWQAYGFCPYVDGCGMVTYKYAHSAKADDYGCPGSVGIRVKFHPPGAGTKYSATKWGTNVATATGVNVSHYNAYH